MTTTRDGAPPEAEVDASLGGSPEDSAPAPLDAGDSDPVVILIDAALTEDSAPSSIDAAPLPIDAAPLPIDAAPLPIDAAPLPIDAAPPPPRSCLYPALDYEGGMREYDVNGASNERLGFEIWGVPDPSLIAHATLIFNAYDADHPGEEGRIWVNSQGPYGIPADAAWDNQTSEAQVDVTGALVAGVNAVEFGSSLTQARTFYRIGAVALHLEVQIDDCDEAPPPPPPQAEARTIRYEQAEYTQRHNWAFRCNDYAFTARGDEHHPDCEGLYEPDGSRRGTAIFRFDGLVEATYEISMRSRHTENRNPQGALFIVEGDERRISQRSDRGYTDDVWGRKRLSGQATVILDSSREGESDSIISVTVTPVGP